MLKDKLLKLFLGRNNEEKLELCNPDLLVIKQHNKLKICVVYNHKNKKWIENHLETIDKLQNLFAVTLEGKSIEIKSLTFKHGQKVYIKNNQILDSLYAYSPKSNGVLWAAEKFDALSSYEKNDLLSIGDLLVLQDKINEQHLENLKGDKPEEVETL